MQEIDDRIYELVGEGMTVLNVLGHGFREKTYERALLVEFQHLDIRYMQQKQYTVINRGVKIDEYIPDLEVEDCVIVDTKVIERIGDNEIGQMLNYLKISGKQFGLILNFKHPKIEWRKVTLQSDATSNSPNINVH